MRTLTFLTYEKPLLTCMVQAETPERIKELISLSLPEGAEAFGMQFCRMMPEYRTEENYRELFASTSSLPTYVTNYRLGYNQGKSDDVLSGELLTLAECGATLCDVMGDYFDACEGELTMNDDAVKKQMKLIGELHERGAEALMSSHIREFTPAERVLEIALEHQRRGADICKIVTGASNIEEELENLRITNLLKKTLKIPFLFLSGGTSYIARRLGGAFGNCMTLCVHEYDKLATKSQPLLSDVKILRDSLGL